MSRRRSGHAEEHVNHERWLVSYADFVTLLFAFFVVLFASSNIDRMKIARMAAAIHGAFQHGGDVGPGGAPQPIPEPPPSAPPPQQEAAMSAVPDSIAFDVSQLRRDLEKALGDELKNHEIEVQAGPTGFIISLKELGFFGPGDARLLPGAANKLFRIAEILNHYDFDIRVEGHTDNQKIHNAEFPSNWELSAARAMEVLHIFVEKFNVDPSRLSAAGYAEYHPHAPNDTPEGRKMNRRVDLVVMSRKVENLKAFAAQ